MQDQNRPFYTYTAHSTLSAEDYRPAGDPATPKPRRAPAQRLLRLLRENNEFWGIPLGLLLFWAAPPLLRLIDSTAGTFDLGILHALLWGVAAFMVVKGVVWLLLWLDFPELYHWLDDWFARGLYAPQPGLSKASLVGKRPAQISAALGLYAFYILCIVILTVAIL